VNSGVSRRAVAARVVALAAALGGAATAGGPQPPAAPTLALWLRADAGVATAKDTGLVTSWADGTSRASGIGDKTGQDAKAPSDAARPRLVAGALRGRPAVRFDGKDDRLDFTLPVNGLGQLTIFLVAANTARQDPGWAAHHHLALGWGYTGGWGICGLSTFQDTVAARFATGDCFAAAVHARPRSIGAAFSLVALRKNGTRHALFAGRRKVWNCISGAPTVVHTSDAGAVGGGLFGAPRGSDFYRGDVAEILVYTTALSDKDRQAVERYLLDKWLR